MLIMIAPVKPVKYAVTNVAIIRQDIVFTMVLWCVSVMCVLLEIRILGSI